jgi:hypothetical protein
MKIKVEHILEVDTDLESVDDVMKHIQILGPIFDVDDVVSVTNVEIGNYSKVI